MPSVIVLLGFFVLAVGALLHYASCTKKLALSLMIGGGLLILLVTSIVIMPGVARAL